MRKLALSLLASMLAFAVTAQQAPPSLLLHSGTVTLPEGTAPVAAVATAGEAFGGYHFRLFQFSQLPGPEVQAALQRDGVRLLDYIPVNAYIVALPSSFDGSKVGTYGLRSITPVSPDWKIKQNLRELPLPEWAVRPGNQIDLSISYYEVYDRAVIASALQALGYSLLDTEWAGSYLELRADVSDIASLASLPFVNFIEPVNPEAVPENYTGRTLHRSNVIASDFDGGRKYDGTGVTVAMGDDGIIGPHIDYQGRVDNSRITNNTGNHGDHVGGTIMGGGNLDPKNKGMAFGANLDVYSVWDAVTDGPGEGQVITSTSYSNGCNAGYTSFARSADQQTRNNLSLIHIFSAGNEGTKDCDYGAGAGWGNITGGVKIGKNVICVADLSATDVLASSSSRGPTTDGRIKPDVGAKGTSVVSTVDPNDYANFSGTSMACPGVSGTMAQLYHAYKTLNGGVNPPSALMKAIMMNTADDVGNAGPDFKFGYGRINALRSVLAIENGSYLSDSISTGDSITHVLTVPPGVAEMKVMVYWHDREGSVLASPALVNNLDITLTDPGASVYQPWVLNPAPSPVTLNLPAVRGVDVLNNQEQVTLTAPAAGSYTLTVRGTAIPFGPQEYWVVYDFIDSNITVTRPIGGEPLVPSESERVRWDAVGTTGTFTVELSVDSGATWSTLSSTVPGDRRYFDFSVPSTPTGLGLVRVSRSGSSDVSDATFTILRVPGSLDVVSSCPDECELQWTSVAGATSYEVSMLGAKYMDSIGTTTATNFTVVGVGQFDEAWFSVKALGPDNAVGRRAVAVFKEKGIWNCSEPGDAGITEITNPTSGAVQSCHNLSSTMVSVKLFNNSPTAITDIPIWMSLDGGTAIGDTVAGPLPGSGTLNFTFGPTLDLSPVGTHTIEVWLSSSADGNPYNDSASVKLEVITGSPVVLPVAENFETFTFCSTAMACEAGVCPMANGFHNATNNQGDNIDWRTDANNTPTAETGPPVDHNPGTATGRYLYTEASNCFEKTAVLITPCLDLTTAIKPEMSFWFHMYGVDMGELHVDVIDDGVWVRDVTPKVFGNWADKWWERVIDLTPYKGGFVTVVFRGITGPGGASDMAIDDISILEKGVGVDNSLFGSAVRVYPNPSNGVFQISGENLPFGSLDLMVTDLHGRVIATRELNAISGSLHESIDLSSQAAGMYLLHLRSDNGVSVAKVVVE